MADAQSSDGDWLYRAGRVVDYRHACTTNYNILVAVRTAKQIVAEAMMGLKVAVEIPPNGMASCPMKRQHPLFNNAIVGGRKKQTGARHVVSL